MAATPVRRSRSGSFSLLHFMGASASAQTPNPDRDAYFGETHVHTGWSFDAYIFGNTKTTPADAYKYAIGEPIKHPPVTTSRSRLLSTGWA